VAKLKEELAEAKAIIEKEGSLRDGTCSHTKKLNPDYFKLPVIFGRLSKRTNWCSLHEAVIRGFVC